MTFSHFGAIKSLRPSRGLFIVPKCVKSSNQLPLHSKMWNYSVPFYHTCQNDSCSRQIVEFYEINKFSLKTTPFYKKRPHFIENYPFFIENYPPFIKKKLRTTSREKTPTSHSAFIENSIFGNKRDPCLVQWGVCEF